jgi:hypothetical protein
VKPDRLNKRIRETVSALSDEKLRAILDGALSDYSPYARQVAAEELMRRREERADRAGRPVSAICNPDFENCDEETNGCYVIIWSGKDCEGEHLRIDGPIQYNTLTAHSGSWGNDISSLKVGPEAFVEIFADENFQGKMICFGPGEAVPDLAEYAFDDDAESIKVISSIRLLERARQDPKEEQSMFKGSLEQALVAEQTRKRRKDRMTGRRRKRR